MENKVENVFKNKNFTLTFLGALVSNIGALLFNFAVSFYILELTNNDSVMQGLYLAMCGLVFIIFNLFGGVIADKFNQGKIMFICDYAKGFFFVGVSFIILAFNENVNAQLVLLFITGFVGQIIAGIFTPSINSLFPFILKPEQLQQGQSYFSMLNNFEAILGVLLGAVFYSLMPMNWLIFSVGIAYMCSAISEMFIKYQKEKSPNKLTMKNIFQDLKEGFTYLNQKRAIFTLIIIILFINFFHNPITTSVIPFMVATDIKESENFLFHEFLHPESWSAALTILLSASSIFASFILSRKFNAKNIARKISIWLFMAALAVMVFALSYILFVDNNTLDINYGIIGGCIAMIITGVAIANINIPIGVSIQLNCDRQKLGKVNSFIASGTQGLLPLASLLAGILLKYCGISITLFIYTIGLFIAWIIFTTNKSVKSL